MAYVGSEFRGRDVVVCVFFFQAEDGIRDLVRSRGLGDVYKRQVEFMLIKRLTFPRLSIIGLCARGSMRLIGSWLPLLPNEL